MEVFATRAVFPSVVQSVSLDAFVTGQHINLAMWQPREDAPPADCEEVAAMAPEVIVRALLPQAFNVEATLRSGALFQHAKLEGNFSAHVTCGSIDVDKLRCVPAAAYRAPCALATRTRSLTWPVETAARCLSSSPPAAP